MSDDLKIKPVPDIASNIYGVYSYMLFKYRPVKTNDFKCKEFRRLNFSQRLCISHLKTAR